MKVNIGPYKNHISTHKIKCDYLQLMYGDDWYDVVPSQYNWLDHVVVGLLEGIDYCLKPINKYNKRKIKVKYHYYDTWGLDHTLALIILPGLRQLKDTNPGYANVDNEDLPTACLKDASGEERWEWVMDEMIWAFYQIANDYPEEDILNIDFEGRKKYDNRIQRALTLFGKYYRNLWD